MPLRSALRGDGRPATRRTDWFAFKQMMIDWLKRASRDYPRIRGLAISLWDRLINVSWRVRKALRRPVTYAAGSATVKLHPEGQIPEALWKGSFESIERDFVSAFLRPGMQVVNIGANVGLYAVMASRLVSPDGEVHAFEPSALSHSRLLKNIRLNGCQNVIVNQVALLDVAGEFLLRADPQHPECDGHRFVTQLGAVRQLLASDEVVQSTTLDVYTKGLRRGHVDLMIIDVEGAELPVLRGAIDTLRKCQPTLLLECTRQHEETERFLADLGYKFWAWDVGRSMLVRTAFREAARVGDVIVRVDGWPV